MCSNQPACIAYLVAATTFDVLDRFTCSTLRGAVVDIVHCDIVAVPIVRQNELILCLHIPTTCDNNGVFYVQRRDCNFMAACVSCCSTARFPARGRIGFSPVLLQFPVLCCGCECVARSGTLRDF